MPAHTTRPILLLIHGVPGSGKSAFARQFADEHGLTHVNTDRIRFELYDDATFSPSENKLVFDLGLYMAEELLKAGQSVLFDMLLPSQKIRTQVAELAKKHGADFLIVWLQTDVETAAVRAASRDRRRPDDKYSFPMPAAIFERLSNIHPLGERERYLVISGKHPYRQQSHIVTKKLQALGQLSDAPPLHRRLPSRAPARPPITRSAESRVRPRAD